MTPRRKRISAKRTQPRRRRGIRFERLEDRRLLAVVSHWTADGTVADAVGTNHATLVGGAGYAAGQVGQAFRFDSDDDRVIVPDSPSLELTKSISVEAWIRVDSYPGQYRGKIMVRGDDRVGLDPYELSVTSDRKVQFQITNLNGDSSIVSTWVPEDQFVHVAATLDDATGVMRIYFNGESVAQKFTTVRPIGALDPNSNPGISIGNHGLTNSTYARFHGLVDELKIHDSVLTSEAIQSYFDATKGDYGYESPPWYIDEWYLHNVGQDGSPPDVDIDLPEAWAVSTGSMSTIVAINDDGVDYTHKDLYQNIWLNEGEIPATILPQLVDADADGIITFRDLNDPANASLTSDLNATGYIDGGDLLQDPIWEDGIDTDGNGLVDDLIGWDFYSNDNDPMQVNGHGTDMAIFIGGSGEAVTGLTGINQNVRILPTAVRVGPNDWSPEAGIAAVDYTIEMGAPISHNLWAHAFYQEVYDAFDRARLAGQLITTGSGNVGIDLDANPELSTPYFELDNVLVANGADEYGKLFGHNWGATTVHVSAPTPDYRGVSASSAFVTGVAALLHSVHPNWNAAQLKSRIMETVDPRPRLAGLTVTGGTVNVAKAVGVIENELFVDSFENGQLNGLWVQDGQNDWSVSSHRSSDGSQSAEIDGSTNDAALTVADPIDLSGALSAKITFDWFIESSFDSGEYLKLDLFDGSNWNEILSLDGDVDAEDLWHNEVIELDSSYLNADFKLRFRADVSSPAEDGNVDNVRVVAMQLPGAPSLAIDDQQVSEGDSGTTTVTFTVTRSGDTSGTSSVDFTTADGTATVADGDYSSKSGTLQFLATETTKSITVDVHGDLDEELDESFLVNLTNPTGATITNGSGVGTILSDDLPNQAPTALAGPDQTVSDSDGNGSEVVTLQGGGTDEDGTIVSYQWTEGTTVLGDTATIAPTLDVGMHVLTLTVTDNEGAIGTDTVEITVSAVSPTTAIFVSDISFQSRKGGKEWRAIFEIRDEFGLAVPGALITFTFADQPPITRTTDSNGQVRSDWLRLSSGTYEAEVNTDVAPSGYSWDLTQSFPNEDDSDLYPDAYLTF